MKMPEQNGRKRTPSRNHRRRNQSISLSLLQEMFTSLATTFDETEVLSRAAGIIGNYFNYSVVAINILDESQSLFMLKALSARLSENTEMSTYLPIGQGVIGAAARLRQPVLIDDTRDCQYYIEMFPATRSELACPIMHGEQLLGVLNLESERPKAFTADDIQVIEVLASALAFAIENTRAFRRIEELSATKDALLERLSHDYQHIFENALQGMSRSTPDGRFLIVNPAFARMLGYATPEQLLKVDIAHDIYANPVERQRVVTLLEQQGTVTDFETQFKRLDNQIIDVKINARRVRDGSGRTIYYDGLVEDISEQKRLQQTLQRRERMATMGELAAAIAHEIRNPLAAVLNSAEELQARIELSGTNQRLLEIILEEVERLERIVRDFLDFARPSAPKCEPADINQILEKTLELVAQSHLVRAELTIERQFTEPLPTLSLDADRMIQVFLNVMLNAAQAIKRAGTITVKTGLINGDNGVLIEISDTGAGVKSDCLERIFEPFFTTKPSGTGLGLPIAKQIIEMHGGTIGLTSEFGVGTTVRIILPTRR